jgi:hypothetical protein
MSESKEKEKGKEKVKRELSTEETLQLLEGLTPPEPGRFLKRIKEGNFRNKNMASTMICQTS